jgi:hypothetical protein
MVLISIHPFASRKILLAIVAFLCFSALCFADPVLMVRRYAPHPERLAPGKMAVSSSQERQDTVVAEAETDSFQSVRLTCCRTKSQLTRTGGTGLARTAPLTISQNTMGALRSGWQDETAGWPTLPLPGEI